MQIHNQNFLKSIFKLLLKVYLCNPKIKGFKALKAIKTD